MMLTVLSLLVDVVDVAFAVAVAISAADDAAVVIVVAAFAVPSVAALCCFVLL